MFILPIFLSLFFFLSSSAHAVFVPTFPSCLVPQGALKVEHTDGVHGVVGDPAIYRGRDLVFTLSDSTLFQCLCPDNGQGIQTNWWKIDGMSTEDIEFLKSDGWIFIPDGAAWGLASGPYLAKNLPYDCTLPRVGGVGGGESFGAQVYGLAPTGNKPVLYGFTMMSGISLFLAWWLGHQKFQYEKKKKYQKR